MARKKRTPNQLPLTVGAGMLVEDASLADEAQRRYLNYALSVITARALPDVRDGLKPVQRRILYAMFRELSLHPDGRYKKSAGVVGEVMAKFHPHGDQAIYDTMVRMAQPFSLRKTLVDGRGNFGSADGDPPAAMRYTEAKLTPLAEELLVELAKHTVHDRPTYDGERTEPVVLPARFPNLLVNGSYGIAVGMATSVPTHNLGEVIKALIALSENSELSLRQALRFIKGPDFPTGGELLASRQELESVYADGQGSLKLRGTWSIESTRREGEQLVIESIPFAVERRHVVEKIYDIIAAKKLAGLLSVRDESTDSCSARIVCELKKDADPQLIMAYLYRHTPLSTNIQFNMTCLVPAFAEGTSEAAGDAPVPVPRRLGLLAMLRQFLSFRMEVIKKRTAHDLKELERRIHVLEGLEIVFDALDETIRIIRRSDGRQDAAAKLMQRFSLDQLQVDEILNLRLYRLAKLQILVIRQELEEKRKEAQRLAKLLKSEAARWALLRDELTALADRYADKRCTRIVEAAEEPSFEEAAFIAEEDAMALLSEQGWVKRQQRIKDLTTTRLREGDSVRAVIAGSTRSTVAFFSSRGVCYVARLVDLPATSGFGVPVQTMFALADGERIVAMVGMDPRQLDVPTPAEGATEPEPPFAIAVTRRGMSLRFSLRGHREPSTKAGRKFARPREGDEVLFVAATGGSEDVAVASRRGRALLCAAEDIPTLAGAGKGVTLIKLANDDEVLGAALLSGPGDRLSVEKDSGTQIELSTRKYGAVGRGGKGFLLLKRGELRRALPAAPVLPNWLLGEEP